MPQEPACDNIPLDVEVTPKFEEGSIPEVVTPKVPPADAKPVLLLPNGVVPEVAPDEPIPVVLLPNGITSGPPPEVALSLSGPPATMSPRPRPTWYDIAPAGEGGFIGFSILRLCNNACWGISPPV